MISNGPADASRSASRQLEDSALLGGVPEATRAIIDQYAQWVRLGSGDLLCRAGEPADAVFLVVSGALEVFADGTDGERLLAVIGKGASVGEMAVLNGEDRSANVRALRDSELIRIPADAFATLLAEHPAVALNVARMLSDRLRTTSSTPRVTRSTRTVTIVRAGDGDVPAAFAALLMTELARIHPRVRCVASADVDAALGAGTANSDLEEADAGRLMTWLGLLEADNSVVLYLCDARPTGWTLRALREADLILAVGNAAADHRRNAIEEMLAAGAARSRARRELILEHDPSTVLPSGTRAWLDERSVTSHHHVRREDTSDHARLARAISGTSVGIALSGGGARGFAHIGVLAALRDRGYDVDVVCGASMGSVIAAQAALKWDTASMIERNREGFMHTAVVGDFTFPFVSLMRGRSTIKLLRSMFDDIAIEDCWLPYFCVTTNLSRAQVVVHDRGPLWLWTRASSSVPGIGPPVPFDGDLLVDGGVLNNLPVDILRARCAGTIVAVDASPAVELPVERGDATQRAEMSGWPYLWHTLNRRTRTTPFPNVFEILLRTSTISSAHHADAIKRDADLYLHPPVEAISPLDWSSIQRAVDIGYADACTQIDAWEARLAAAAS